LNISLPSVTILKNEMSTFDAVLRKHPHAHSFYSVGEFGMCKDDI